MFKLSGSCHSYFIVADVPYWSLCHRFDYHLLGARSPVSLTPHLVGRASLCCRGLSRIRTRWWAAKTFACVGCVHQVSIDSFSGTQKLPFQSFGFKYADILSIFFIKTVQPKIDSLLIESLGVTPRSNSAGHFFAPHLTTKFLIIIAWKIVAPHIILGRPEPMNYYLAISSSILLHLSANPFFCCVSSIVFSCWMPASKKYLSIRETPSPCFCLIFFGVPQWDFRAGQCFVFSLKQAHKHKRSVLFCKDNPEQKPWPWLYSERSHHVYEIPIQLLVCLRLCHSWYWSLCDLANAHKLNTLSNSPNVSGAFVTKSAEFKWPNCLCHFLALSRFTQLELILNSRTL